jgi:hypothetical protein
MSKNELNETDKKLIDALKDRLSEERILLLRDYFAAASNFYRIVPLKRLLRIINSQNEEQFSEEDFLAFANIAAEGGTEIYYFIKGLEEFYDDKPKSEPINRLIVQEPLVEFDDVFFEMMEAKEGRKYFVPEKEELLKYSDDFYEDKNKFYTAMFDFCKSAANCSDDTATEYMYDIVFTVKSEESTPFTALELINKFSDNLNIVDNRLGEFIRLYSDLHNNTRNPYLNGFTPNEWFQCGGNKADSRVISAEEFL